MLHGNGHGHEVYCVINVLLELGDSASPPSGELGFLAHCKALRLPTCDCAVLAEYVHLNEQADRQTLAGRVLLFSTSSIFTETARHEMMELVIVVG